MFAFIKNILFNKNNLRKDIEFVHHKPKIYNISDDFCSPKHYFKFENPINNLTIIGGGIYPLLAKKYIKKNNLRRNQIVLWGIGESNSKNSNIEKLVIDKNFIQIGVRDISSVSKEYFLPCVSCLNKMLDLPILKNNTVVFLNRDIDVTDIIDDEFKEVLLNKQWNLVFNNCNYEDSYRHREKQDCFLHKMLCNFPVNNIYSSPLEPMDEGHPYCHHLPMLQHNHFQD